MQPSASPTATRQTAGRAAASPSGVARWARLVRATLVPVALVLLLAFHATSARAESALTRGLALANEAEFEAALAAFDDAIEHEQLSRSELVTLLTERVLLFHALVRPREQLDDLRYLAAIEPDFQFDARFPPAVLVQFHELTSQTVPLELRPELTREREDVRIKAHVSGARSTPGAVVSIALRPSGGAWSVHEGDELLVPSARSAVDYYVEVTGLGHAPLLKHGNAEQPIRELALSSDTLARDDSPSSAPNRHRRRRWIAGLAVSAVAAVALTLALTLPRDSEQTKLQPQVQF
jgi:anti-sigma-K factor RskA